MLWIWPQPYAFLPSTRSTVSLYPHPPEIVAALASSGFLAEGTSLITAGLRIARAEGFTYVTDTTLQKHISKYGGRPGWTTLAALVGVPPCDLPLLEEAVSQIDGQKCTPGSRVTARGLMGATELNNLNGTILVWVQENGRYRVQFDNSGLVKLLQPDNLVSARLL